MYMYVIRLLKVIEVSFGSCMLTVKPGLHPQALHVNGALSDLPSYLFICLVKFFCCFLLFCLIGCKEVLTFL